MNEIRMLADNGRDVFCELIEKQTLKTKKFQAGDYLLKQGDTIDKLYWVGMGQCEISHTEDNGKRFSLGLYFADNRLFGEVELLTDSPCQFDICANEYIEAKVIPIEVMSHILQLEPKVAIWLSQSISQKYQNSISTEIKRFLYPLIYNVAWDIWQRHIGAKPSVNFSKVYKEAERFGCPERVYRRVVSQMLKMGLIEKVDNQLQVLSTEKLSSFLETQNLTSATYEKSTNA